METEIKNGNFISLHRQILNWGWYKVNTVKSVFLDLLLRANFKDKNWCDLTIKRGQVFTTEDELAKSTGCTVKQVRLAIVKLVKTGEIQKDAKRKKGTMFTICNYNKYQRHRIPNGNQTTLEGQTKGIRKIINGRIEGNNTQNDNINNIHNNDKKEKKENKERVTPSLEDVIFYFKEKKIQTVNPNEFFDYYNARDWEVKGTKIKNWKSCVTSWLKKSEQFDKKPINPLSEYKEL